MLEPFVWRLDDLEFNYLAEPFIGDWVSDLVIGGEFTGNTNWKQIQALEQHNTTLPNMAANVANKPIYKLHHQRIFLSNLTKRWLKWIALVKVVQVIKGFWEWEAQQGNTREHK